MNGTALSIKNSTRPVIIFDPVASLTSFAVYIQVKYPTINNIVVAGNKAISIPVRRANKLMTNGGMKEKKRASPS